MSLFSETCTLRGRQVVGRDDYGNDLYEWTEAPSPCWVEQRNGTEQQGPSEQSVANSWLYLPLTTPLPVSAVSEVVYDGRTWDVDGDPGRQPGGFAVEGYQLVAIRKVTG